MFVLVYVCEWIGEPLPIGVLATAMFVTRLKRDKFIHSHTHTHIYVTTHRLNRIYSIRNYLHAPRAKCTNEALEWYEPWQPTRYMVCARYVPRLPDVLIVCMSAYSLANVTSKSQQQFNAQFLCVDRHRSVLNHSHSLSPWDSTYRLWDANICNLVYGPLQM